MGFFLLFLAILRFAWSILFPFLFLLLFPLGFLVRSLYMAVAIATNVFFLLLFQLGFLVRSLYTAVAIAANVSFLLRRPRASARRTIAMADRTTLSVQANE